MNETSEVQKLSSREKVKGVLGALRRAPIALLPSAFLGGGLGYLLGESIGAGAGVAGGIAGAVAGFVTEWDGHHSPFWLF